MVSRRKIDLSKVLKWFASLKKKMKVPLIEINRGQPFYWDILALNKNNEETRLVYVGVGVIGVVGVVLLQKD